MNRRSKIVFYNKIVESACCPLTVIFYSLLVVLFVGAVYTQQAGDECVVTEPLREGLYAAHPTDCGQYLQCDTNSNRYVARSCARGLRLICWVLH